MKRRGRPLGAERGRGTRAAAKLLAAIALILIAAVVADLRLRPIIETVLISQAKSYAMRIINTAMMEELSREDTSYEDIVRLSRNGDGSVTSVETDVAAANRLKARLTNAVMDGLSTSQNQSVKIPVGTLLGNQFTAGRGPEVEVRVILLNVVQSDLEGVFKSAGINQTLHQVMLQTDVEIAAVLPGYTVRTNATTSFCVAETVIVGPVPEGYTIVGEDDSSTISKINDYKAGD